MHNTRSNIWFKWLPAYVLITSMMFMDIMAYAEMPAPAPREFINFSTANPCADKSKIRAKIVENGTKLTVVRKNCQNINAIPLKEAAPQGMNSIETDFLAYEGKLFENVTQNEQSAILFCRSEGSTPESKKSKIKVSLRAQPNSRNNKSFILGFSDTSSGTVYWSLMHAEKSAQGYIGRGSMNPKDVIKLNMRSEHRADVEYALEVQQEGKSSQATGNFRNLHCYSH